MFGRRRQKTPFDPDSASSSDSGIFGLDCEPEDARVVVIPVPFEATTSYGSGTADGPEAILRASHQVDLFDLENGEPWQSGISMIEIPERVVRWNLEARNLAKPIIERGGDVGKSRRLRKSLARVNEIGIKLNEWVYQETKRWLDLGKMPVVLGGDHSVPFGAMRAYSEAHPGLGILHLDAHADLREAYEGFAWSHASIFYNVLNEIPQVSRIVQVGVRDIGKREDARIRESGGRIRPFFDHDLAARKDEGEPWARLADEIVAELPRSVYLSWDIDGFDPALSPSTGTPVPGGLSWQEAMGLLRALIRANKRIVGFDLCEVALGPTEWDANVGARLLYKMIGFALKSER